MPGLELVLTVACPDRPGLVHAVAGFVVAQGGNILESQQYNDRSTQRFFMRVHLAVSADADLGVMRAAFGPVAGRLDMVWALVAATRPTRVIVMVSRLGHCLNDLIFRYRTGALNIEIAAVVSNHGDLAELTEAAAIPFHHIPANDSGPAGQPQRREQVLREMVADLDIDLVILARYMQILSPALCADVPGRIINIHHSFLPSFSGARPYHQAHDRGVKLIGATAHYVTPDLDEGPIIEQDVTRVDHTAAPADLAAAGRDVEAQVLARAVRWHSEHRVLLNGDRTVVLR